jgi:hypothetical protein
VIEHLPTMCKVLDFIPDNANKQTNNSKHLNTLRLRELRQTIIQSHIDVISSRIILQIRTKAPASKSSNELGNSIKETSHSKSKKGKSTLGRTEV